MPTTPETKYQCRHIFPDGHRCGSPCLRTQELCYQHHATRRPLADPHHRRARGEAFTLTLPEDRASIQIAIGEVLTRIAAGEIDARRAGLILYGLQIASLNLPKVAPLPAPEAPAPLVEMIVEHPVLGTIAPKSPMPVRPKGIAELLLEPYRPAPKAPAAPALLDWPPDTLAFWETPALTLKAAAGSPPAAPALVSAPTPAPTASSFRSEAKESASSRPAITPPAPHRRHATATRSNPRFARRTHSHPFTQS